jgi:hypothetical protein
MRSKEILFVASVFFLLSGCGKKSVIKNHVEAEKLACAYGDCRHIIKSVTFPLDNSALAFKTPLPGLGPIAGGIVKFVGDIFAKNTNQGRLEISYTQPIPEIPNEVHSVRLKRFFFYMKPVDKKRRSFRSSVQDWINRYILGRGHTTFAFLDKIAVRLSATDVYDPDTYVPSLLNKLDNEDAEDSLMKLFDENYRQSVVDTEVAQDLILLKYHKKKKAQDTSSKQYGKIHYLETTKDPADVKKFLLSQLNFKGNYKRILLLEKSLLIELEKDPVCDEIFKNLMISKAEEMGKELGVNFIDTCTEDSCLEVNVPDVNIIPIARKGNALKLDAIIHAADVPESFKLKGFVEFETRIDSKI